MTTNTYHIPIMGDEVVTALNIRAQGTYVDGTLGGGGHSSMILARLAAGTGRLIGIDQDRDALAATGTKLDSPLFTAVHGNFHDMPGILQTLGVDVVDGVLLDLGVSSYQLDTAERGFSYRMEGPLDMRMDQNADKPSAYDIVNTFPEAELTRILYAYGEERYAPRIARGILMAREKHPVETTAQLIEIVVANVPARYRHGGPHPAMRTFMALRIAVNDELDPLDGVLRRIIGCLAPGGRMAVITFHSLEDRIVKKCFAQLADPCTCPRDIPYCACGNKPLLRMGHLPGRGKAVKPTPAEIAANSRAHSAKLRVAEKI